MKKDYRYILIIAAVIILYGSANIYFAINHNEPFYYVWTAFCFPTTLGLLLNKNWSKYLVYLLAAVTSGGWAYFTYHMYLYGWSEYETEHLQNIFILGVFLIGTSVLFSAYVYKYFKS